jgi:hypothetical protein
MHGIADVLLTHRIGPGIQLLEARGTHFMQPFQQFRFGQFRHAQSPSK